MTVYANEWDKHAAHWLSCLPLQFDEIDTRSIEYVQGSEIANYDQCHFFAGIGGWPLALEIAGWPNDARVWTGSCPCQPFSQAGKRKGTSDERHLWPEFARLINECRPPTIFGEQVASKAGRDWLATVRTDLEAMGYAVGAADLCAASVGAPHIRQRLFWVAHRSGERLERRPEQSTWNQQPAIERGGDAGRMANTGRQRSDARRGQSARMEARERAQQVIDNQQDGWMGDTNSSGGVSRSEATKATGYRCASLSTGWANAAFAHCRDGKARPVKPGVRLLAHGIPGRVAQLRGLGNAIVPQVAAEFVKAFIDHMQILEPQP